jgi:diguanylate cyclase (GGDEF)-like protein
MHPAPAILIIFLGLFVTLCTYLAAYTYMRIPYVPEARCYFFVIVSISIYILGYAIEISRTDLAGVLAAIRLEYCGLAFAATMILLFAIRFTRQKDTPLKYVAALMVVSVTTLVLVFTQSHHDLFYINPRLVDGGLFTALTFERGIWYNINFVYQQIVSLAAFVILVRQALRTKGRLQHQAIALALGVLAPSLGSIYYFLGLIPFKVDSGPFVLSITAMLTAWALFRLGLFELIPAGREMALDSICDGLLVIDNNGRLVDMNNAARKLPGAESFRMGDLLPGDNQLVAHLRPLIETEASTIAFCTDPQEGCGHHYKASVYPLSTRETGVQGIAILISEVTDTVELLRRLNHQANTDELTGVLNRRQLMSLGANELTISRQTGAPLGVVMIDLDQFKSINDQYGHAVGDTLLKKVAQSLREKLRANDILGRYGGDEFVAFLPATNITQAMIVAERLNSRLLAENYVVEEESLTITASFGVLSVCACDDTAIDDLLRAVDVALYQAKANGCGQIAYYPDADLATVDVQSTRQAADMTVRRT